MKKELIPEPTAFIAAYGKLNKFSVETLELFNSPDKLEMKLKLGLEFDSLTAILAEAFNLPNLYNSPEYKLRIVKIITALTSFLFLSQSLNMISIHQFEIINRKLAAIMFPVINFALNYPTKKS